MSEEIEMVEENGDEWEDMDDDADPSSVGEEKQTYLPGQPIGEDEVLTCDETAYVMYHKAHTGAPCLSFDILKDQLGENRTDFPMTVYAVAGTQAAEKRTNSVIVLKLSNMLSTKDEIASEDSDSDSEDEDKKAELEAASINHEGAVNRIRAKDVGSKTLVASWSELGKVHIWEVSRQLLAVNDVTVMSTYTRNEESPPPIYTGRCHQTEGFAVDWSPVVPGALATGDCDGKIHVWRPSEGGSWKIDYRNPFTAHKGSIEDIQWSPTEQSVFASCSVDRSIRIWDARAAPKKACMLTRKDAHERDINVISWNRSEPFIVSGGDDNALHVWDLRDIKAGAEPVATFKHHSSAITSVEWHPTDSTVFAASGSDDQITLWDLSVERDKDTAGEDIKEIPPQLLFIHQGQEDIKELHWHPQCPGVILSTAHSGFNIFKTISV